MMWRARCARPLQLLAGWWLTAIAASVLILPSIGPLLDHHFVERLPSHTHSLAGDVTPTHVHPYEIPGHFGHGTLSRDTLLESGDVLYMARGGGAAIAPGDINTKQSPDSPVFSGLFGRDLPALLGRAAGPLVGAFIPPPWTPPRSVVLSR